MILRGFVPARRACCLARPEWRNYHLVCLEERDLCVKAKGPKTISARSRPFGSSSPPNRITWLRNLLRSNSPRQIVGFVASAQPRPRGINFYECWGSSVQPLCDANLARAILKSLKALSFLLLDPKNLGTTTIRAWAAFWEIGSGFTSTA